jgi:hypothetical protein
MVNPVGGWNWDDQMKGLIEACNQACPSPLPPDLQVIITYSPVTVDPKTGFKSGGDPQYVADPNGPALSAEYQAQLTAWQARWQQVYRDLYPRYMGGQPAGVPEKTGDLGTAKPKPKQKQGATAPAAPTKQASLPKSKPTKPGPKKSAGKKPKKKR